MSERRYVVEIARAVSDDRIESAADYVATRLGMDRQRIRTLLAGRTGPVTRPVLADKADSIAEVFTAAGVTVMIMEALDLAASDAEETGPADAAVAGFDDGVAAAQDDTTDYEADYREDFRQETEPALTDWNVDSAWETEDDDVPWESRPPTPVPGDSAHEYTGQGYSAREEADAEDHDGPPAGSSRGAAGEGPVEPKLPSTRWVPSPFEELADGPAARAAQREDLVVSWGAHGDEGAVAPGDVGGDGGDLGSETSRPWVTPGRSQFGELSAPVDRLPLRTYLMWALVVSVVVLIVLQLLFAVRERGADGATYESGLLAYRAGDFVTARRQWEDVAKSGDAAAQYMLGHLVQNGLGQPWSNAGAAVWYRQAADQGLPEAQVALADLYLRGVGVEPSLETGALWLERAADSGFAPALYQYAELLLHGRGVPQDFDAALDLFARAAATGSAEAADYVALAEHVRSGATIGP